MNLRPREALTWRWGHTTPMKYRGMNNHNAPEMVCNGLWEYRPDFTKDLWKKGADSVDGVRLDGNALAAETGVARFGEPEEIAAVVAFLASGQAAYLQGAILDVDGGWVRAV